MKPSPLDPVRIEAAYAALDPVFRDTPQYVAETLAGELGTTPILKVETVNPIRSFKGRGTDWFVRGLPRASRLVTASAGNFGQGLARAGTRAGHAVTVFTATNANPLKLARMRALGAEVLLEGADFDAAKAAGREHARATGARWVEDGQEPAISEGAGTIGLELVRGFPDLDAVVIPLGNGALAMGVATWFRQASPRTRVLAVVASGAPAMERSWRERRVVETASADTIADGVAVRVPVPEAVAGLQAQLDDVLAVDDMAILRAMRLAHAQLGLVLEPAGAIGLAALMVANGSFSGQRVATILCGGNLTDAQRGQWLGDGA